MSADLQFNTNPGGTIFPIERMRITAGGNVGIGTPTPSFPLSFGNASGNKIALYDGGPGNFYGIGVQSNVLQIYSLSVGTRVGIGYGNSAAFTEILSVVGNGNVGIGTTNPSKKLHVYLPSAFTEAMIENGAGSGDTGLIIKDAVRQWKLGINVAASGVGQFNLYNLTSLRPVLSADDSNVYLVTGGGSVGIGPVAPTHLLELASDSAAKPGTNTWTITSDIRTKQNVRLLEGGLGIVSQLVPIVAEYNGKAHTPAGSRVVSFEPQELRKILPHAVSSTTGKLDPDDEHETDIMGVNTHEVLFHLILAAQQLARRLEAVEGRN
jgi:hypothetical protein